MSTRRWIGLLVIAVGLSAAPAAAAHGEPAQPRRCTIAGTGREDVIRGTRYADVICAGAGDDVVWAGGGADTIYGGRGADRLHGERGGDALYAGHSSPSHDRLYGGAGDDTLVARDGAPYDWVDGGRGTDLCVNDAEDGRARCSHPLDRAHSAAVPIITYHVIGRPAPGTPNPRLWVPPHALAHQMRRLARDGYHVVSLWQVWSYWHGAPLPPRPVVVSFDDGFANTYTAAMPILARHGWAGVLNLALSHLDQRGWGLTDTMIHDLVAHGWEVDSHTWTHAYLPALDARSLRREVAGSRRLLQRRFALPVDFFCYPYGAFDARVEAAVRRAGYLGATTTITGRATAERRFELPRIEVSASYFPF